MISSRAPFFLLGLLLQLAIGVTCLGQGTVHRFELESQAVGAAYIIEVVMPAAAARRDSMSNVRYPAIYCTDWFVLGDHLQSLPRLMDMGRLTEPFVYVGISGPGSGHDWAVARTRDFTPAPPTPRAAWRRNATAANRFQNRRPGPEIEMSPEFPPFPSVRAVGRNEQATAPRCLDIRERTCIARAVARRLFC